MSNYLRSCRCRAVLSIVTGYDEMHLELGKAAFLGAPLQDISLASPSDAEVLWNRERTSPLGLDTEAIRKQFKEGGRAKVQWSS